MPITEIKKTAEQKMAKSIEALKHELQKIRTGRAHPGLLDQVHVDYYGSPVPISGLMTMPPLTTNPEDARPYFRALAMMCIGVGQGIALALERA